MLFTFLLRKKIIDEPMLLMAAQHPLLKMDTKQLRFFLQCS